MNKISDSHFRVILRAKSPGSTSQNKKEARTIEVMNGAINKQASVSVKRWSNNDLIKSLRSEISGIRSYLMKIATSPDVTASTWLIPVKYYDELFDEISHRKTKFTHIKTAAIKDYTEHFSEMLEKEFEVNGNLAANISYPTPNEFERMWDMDVLIEEIEPGSFLANVESCAYESAKEEVQRALQVREDELRSSIRMQVYDLVNIIADLLQESKKLRGARFDQLKELTNNILEFSDDNELRVIINKIQSLLNSDDIESIRKVEYIREAHAQSYKEIASDLSDLF